MADAYLEQGPLAWHALDALALPERGDAGIALGEANVGAQVLLRGEGDDAAFLDGAGEVLGMALSTIPNRFETGAVATALWLGPSEWLLLTALPAGELISKLQAALAGCHHALVDVSDSRIALHLAGPAARDLLAKGCSLDLHPSVFAPGQCAQSTLAGTGLLLRQLAEDAADGPVYQLFIQRSFADHVWRWVEDAAAEFGYQVVFVEET